MVKSSTVRAVAGVLALALPLAAQAGEVRNREGRQQARIAQGIGSGQVTAGEAARLEGREARINATRTADLAANGGRLAPQERASLNRRENAASARIFDDKHNDATQPGVAPR